VEDRNNLSRNHHLDYVDGDEGNEACQEGGNQSHTAGDHIPETSKEVQEDGGNNGCYCIVKSAVRPLACQGQEKGDDQKGEGISSPRSGKIAKTALSANKDRNSYAT